MLHAPNTSAAPPDFGVRGGAPQVVEVSVLFKRHQVTTRLRVTEDARDPACLRQHFQLVKVRRGGRAGRAGGGGGRPALAPQACTWPNLVLVQPLASGFGPCAAGLLTLSQSTKRIGPAGPGLWHSHTGV